MSNIVQVPASPANYTIGRLGYSINGLIIHTMVCSLAVCDATFENPARGASAHYGVACDGSVIHQYVGKTNIAWHCGRFYPDALHPLGNTNTIGIEHCDNGNYNSPRPDGLYIASAQLVREICAEFHIPINRAHIRKHNEVSVLGTGCPDSLDIDRIVAMATGPAPIITTEEDMLYVGPTHQFTATFKTFAAGQIYRERTTSSPVIAPLGVGATVNVTGYSYSTSPVQSPDLGGGVPGPDYIWWWKQGTGWVSDAILITTGTAGVPPPAIPAAEVIDSLYATQAQVAALPAGTKGDKGDPGVNGKDGLPGPPGTTPDHKHGMGTTGPMVV